MKVMQILPSVDGNGRERNAIDVAKALVKAGHNSVIVSNGGVLVKRLEKEGSTHVKLPVLQKSLANLWQIMPLRQLIREHNPDIVHVHARTPAWIAHFAIKGLRLAEKPKVVSTINRFYKVNRYSQIMMQADKVIVVSHFMQDYVKKNFAGFTHYHAEKITLINRGIDAKTFIHRYNPSVYWWKSIFTEFPELENKRWLTIPGKISRAKGHDWVFDILGGLQEQFPNLHVVLVGDLTRSDTLYVEEFKQRLFALDLEDKVTFTGYRDDMREWLAASDVVLSLSNKQESFAYTIAQAIFLGTPAVAWHKGATGEILTQLFPKGLVEPNNAIALCKAIRHLLSNPDYTPRPTQYSLKQMTDETITLYQKLLHPIFTPKKHPTTP